MYLMMQIETYLEGIMLRWLRGIRGMSARRLMRLAGVLYVASWCLPAAETSGDLFRGTIWGWQAFLFALSPALGNDMDAGLLTIGWTIASALSNVLAVGAVACELRPSTPRLMSLGWALAAAFVINLVWALLPHMLHQLRVGYFLWVIAFGLGALAAFWRSRTSRTGMAAPGMARAAPLMQDAGQTSRPGTK